MTISPKKRQLDEDTAPEKTLQMTPSKVNNLEPHSVSTPETTETLLASPETRSSGQVIEIESMPWQTTTKYSESTPQQSSTERSSNQTKVKLPPLNPRQCYWNGDRTHLRPYNKKWYDHLEILVEEAQEEALMSLKQCFPSAYKYVIQGSSSLIAFF